MRPKRAAWACSMASVLVALQQLAYKAGVGGLPGGLSPRQASKGLLGNECLGSSLVEQETRGI